VITVPSREVIRWLFTGQGMRTYSPSIVAASAKALGGTGNLYIVCCRESPKVYTIESGFALLRVVRGAQFLGAGYDPMGLQPTPIDRGPA
jgi:hypothetical protein